MQEHIKTFEPDNGIYEVIYSNYNYVHITEQMEDVHEKQVALHEELDEIITQIHGLEAEWNDLYNMRLALKNILKNKAKAKLTENSKNS